MIENNRVLKRDATAWMVRRDGRTYPCIVHYYGSLDDVEETIYAAEWMYSKTQSEDTRQAIIDLIALYGKSISVHRNSVHSLIRAIHTKPYHFLSEAFVRDHMESLLSYRAGTVEELNAKVCDLLNQEFMRVRLGGMYDTVAGCKDMYFRISSNDFDWSENIQRMIRLHLRDTETVTVVRDQESTGEFYYYKANGIEINKMSRKIFKHIENIQQPNGCELRKNMNTHFNEIKNIANKNLKLLYGEHPHNAVTNRLKNELNFLCVSQENTLAFFTAMKICTFARAQGHLISFRGLISNSLVAYLIGITDIDPIECKLPWELLFSEKACKRKIAIDLVFSDSIIDSVIAYMKSIYNTGSIVNDPNCRPWKYTITYKYENAADLISTEIDILSYESLTLLEKLSKKMNINIKDIPLQDGYVFELIRKREIIGVEEFDNKFIKDMISLFCPNNYDDLLKIVSLGHGTGVWKDNAEQLCKYGKITLSEIQASRDDVFNYLEKNGVSQEDAYLISEYVYRGRAIEIKQKIETVTVENSLPDWWGEFIFKVKYMFPKGHAMSLLNTALQIAYIKANYPNLS